MKNKYARAEKLPRSVTNENVMRIEDATV